MLVSVLILLASYAQLGCGTAIPSLFLIRGVFDAPPRSDRRVAIHMQDYNDLVFRLVTLPNIILAWCKRFHVSSHARPHDNADTDAPCRHVPRLNLVP